jgi:peptidoglycan/LPS O-acetylase OafA/YrhL
MLSSSVHSDANRLTWLDAARGIAVAAVAGMHLGDRAFPALQELNVQLVNPGMFGVVLFFLVSGFVIPLTLEHKNSLKAFAIARFFRLFPLYWFSFGLVLALAYLRVGHLPTQFLAGMPSTIWWNVTMVQGWFGVPDAIGLYWTLGYEIAFYVTVALLVTVGLHRRIDWIVLVASGYLIVRGIAIPLLDQHSYYFPPFNWGATFLVGTLCYRGWSGALPWRRVFALSALFLGAVVGSYELTSARGHLETLPAGEDPTTWLSPQAGFRGFVLAYATFAILLLTQPVGRLRPLVWLGRISYSVYLLHGVVLQVPLPLAPPGAFVVRLLVLFPLSILSYRYIEQPAIHLGRLAMARISSATGAEVAMRPPMTQGASSPTPEQASKRLNGRFIAGFIPALAIAAVAGYLGGSSRVPESYFTNFSKESLHVHDSDSGWSAFEELPTGDSFVWCAAKTCTLQVRVSGDAKHILRMRLFAFGYPGASTQKVKVSLNQTLLGEREVPNQMSVLSFDPPANLWKDGANQLAFKFKYAEMPKRNIQGSSDVRTLAAAFDWLEVAASPE